MFSRSFSPFSIFSPTEHILFFFLYFPSSPRFLLSRFYYSLFLPFSLFFLSFSITVFLTLLFSLFSLFLPLHFPLIFSLIFHFCVFLSNLFFSLASFFQFLHFHFYLFIFHFCAFLLFFCVFLSLYNSIFLVFSNFLIAFHFLSNLSFFHPFCLPSSLSLSSFPSRQGGEKERQSMNRTKRKGKEGRKEKEVCGVKEAMTE